MMGIKVPFSRSELELAAMDLESKFGSEPPEGAIKFVGEEINKVFSGGQAAMNRRVAEDNGITVSELLASPNYQLLYDNYIQKAIETLAKLFEEKLGVSPVQAWVIILFSLIKREL